MDNQLIELDDEYLALLKRCYHWHITIGLSHPGKVSMYEDGRKLRRFKAMGLMDSERTAYKVSYYFTPDGLRYCMEHFAPPPKDTSGVDNQMRGFAIESIAVCSDLLRRVVWQYDNTLLDAHTSRVFRQEIDTLRETMFWYMKLRAN